MKLYEIIKAAEGKAKYFTCTAYPDVMYKISGGIIYRKYKNETIWGLIEINSSIFITEDEFEFVKTKHEGWVNIFKCNNWYSQSYMYKTPEEAIINRTTGNVYVDTVKVEWED